MCPTEGVQGVQSAEPFVCTVKYLEYSVLFSKVMKEVICDFIETSKSGSTFASVCKVLD